MLSQMALRLVSLARSKQPLLNEFSTDNLTFESTVRYVTSSLYKRIKETPEFLAMLDTAVTDHFLGPVDFFDKTGKPLGPTKLKQIRTFWEDENVQGSFYGQGMDLFIDGSSFGWHIEANSIISSKFKELVAKLKALDPSIAEYATEQAAMPRKISYLAASTMTIMHDESDIKYYIQETTNKKVRWDAEQIVHVKLMELNGEVRGFCPTKALTKEIVMMYMLKDNILAKLANGGSPDYIIALKGANGVSRARFERLKTALESFSHLRKSHGNMPIDAEIETHPLGTDLKDMEYRELAMFVISEFALSLGLPTSRVPFLMSGSGGAPNKGELSGNSEDSYQTKINSRRSNFENAWNVVFRKAGFTFKFRRDNLQDSVRETQASSQRAAYVISVQNSLSRSNKKLTLEAQLALLSGTKTNLTEEDVEDAPAQMMAPGGSPAGIGGRMQPSNIDSADRTTRDISAFKQKTASNNEVSA